MSTVQFFPFHPKSLRWRLFVMALLGVLVGAKSFADGLTVGGFWVWASACLCMTLVAVLVYFYTRLRPRADWGVRIHSRALEISFPLQGELVLPWTQVQRVALVKKRSYLQVSVKPGDSFLIPRSMFDSQALFESMASAVEEKAPKQPFDA